MSIKEITLFIHNINGHKITNNFANIKSWQIDSTDYLTFVYE